ncbi:MAG: hypothetical protein NTY74_09355 [Ignavibacteriae bacterium]|nr:hypothetical protein [Ignavibacteriota bacterium]
MSTYKIVLLFVSFAVLSVLLSSCESTTVSNPSNPADNFQINVWDYSENHYFVDTLYKRCFNEYYNDSITSYTLENSINLNNNYFEVWVQCNTTNMYRRFCAGKVMLGARPQQGYDTSITNPRSIIDNKFAGYFYKLDNSQYYVNPNAGFIGLKINIPVEFHVGVVYRTNSTSNNIFGKGSFESSFGDTLILKLVKGSYSDPSIAPVCWNLQMKNVYKTPYTNLQTTSTVFLKYNVNNVYRDTIPGTTTPLITMLKLDRYNNATLTPPPDGKFDWLLNRTIFPETGYIVFPILEPFGKGIRNYGLDSTYTFTEIYSQKKIFTMISYKAIMYRLSGNAVY